MPRESIWKMKKGEISNRVKLPEVTKLPDFQKFVFNFLQIIFSDQSVISIFPAENFPAGDWLKNDLQKIENKFSSGRHRGTSRLDEIILSSRVRCRSRIEAWWNSPKSTGEGVKEPCSRASGGNLFSIFCRSFFLGVPLFPQRERKGNSKGARVPLPTPSTTKVLEDYLKHRVKIWTRLKSGVLASPWPATHRAKNEKVDAETSAMSGMISSRYHTAHGARKPTL